MKVEMMQRGSSTMARNVLIGSISVILLLVVLYYMKRVEVGRLKHDMSDMVLQRSDREDELNRKLTEYLQKLEDMTRQLGDINSRLQECEDNKASVVMDVQKCKSVHSECLANKEGADSNFKSAHAELNRLKAQQETVNTQLGDHNRNLANVQHSLSTAERELQQCEDEKDSCTASLRDANGQVQECQQRELTCQANLRSHQQNMNARLPAQQPAQPNYQAPNIPGFPAPRNPALAVNNLHQPPRVPGGLDNHQQPQATKPVVLVPSQGDDEGDALNVGGAEKFMDVLEELQNNGNEDDGGEDVRVIGDEERVIGDADRVNEGGEHRDEERPVVLEDEDEGGEQRDEERPIVDDDDGQDRVIDGRAGEEADQERALADANRL